MLQKVKALKNKEKLMKNSSYRLYMCNKNKMCKNEKFIKNNIKNCFSFE
jgi:hypothetical protein